MTVWEEFLQEKQVGAGATSKVYAARRRRDGWAVTIKEIDLAGSEERRERFLREARLCIGLDHPNVIEIHEVRVEGDQAFQIMERLEGAEDLVDRLVEGPLPVEDVLRIGEGIARGLQSVSINLQDLVSAFVGSLIFLGVVRWLRARRAKASRTWARPW